MMVVNVVEWVCVAVGELFVVMEVFEGEMLVVEGEIEVGVVLIGVEFEFELIELVVNVE
ncbi:hypothetical protein [Staphylococcus auricularis]|uniref:hypothetical protein n=1 Tax=Staphylococcus auricularis TaxID=29379 RepID=UPI001780F047|nr:hypothetical protein [Staphylococcus auricularis]